VQSTAKRLFNSLRDKIPELKASILISNTGELGVHSAAGFEFNADTFAVEYATLFRIAMRTAQDTAMGDAFEQILVSDKAILIARRIGADDIAVFVFGANEPLGRLRYEIRRLAEQLVACVA
jgi:predicted regulator of Ras-like GTPase activity (Roadblock/LC7/MglB family)